MTLTQAKAKAGELYDNGQWFKLAMLLLQFGSELIAFIRERKQQKRNDKAKDKDQGTTRPYSETLS